MEHDLTGPDALARMDVLAEAWRETSDGRGTFLACYRLMTGSMISAVVERDFDDPAWVDLLLVRFAEYYFDALAAYEHDPSVAPAAWQLAHDSCRERRWELQRLLLGINAHINVDLPLTVEELLAPEWEGLSAAQREARRRDYLAVNGIIAATVDAVQDTVLEPAVPILALADVLLGPAEEFLMSRMLEQWRESAWENAVALVEAPDAATRGAVVARMEADALAIARAILFTDGVASVLDLFRREDQ